MKVVHIVDGVYACLQEDKGMGYSNSGLVASGRGLVVDTFFDVPRTRALVDAYARAWCQRPGMVLNTHHNGDHCWGNQVLRGCEIIGHRRCAELMMRDDPSALSRLLREAPAHDEGLRDLAQRLSEFQFDGIELIPPTTLVDDFLDVEGCSVPVHAFYVGPAHTASDLIVHLPDQGVLFAGDIVFRRCTPMGWEGTYANWITALERIESLAPAVVVPGHGPICGLDGVREMKAYLQYVRGEAQRHFERGSTSLEAARSIDLGPYADWTEPDRLVFNVERAYAELHGGNAKPDVLQHFRDMQALRLHWERSRAATSPSQGTQSPDRTRGLQ